MVASCVVSILSLFVCCCLILFKNYVYWVVKNWRGKILVISVLPMAHNYATNNVHVNVTFSYNTEATYVIIETKTNLWMSGVRGERGGGVGLYFLSYSGSLSSRRLM